MTSSGHDETTFSIVVASTGGEAALQACLSSLEPERMGAEVVVARAVDDPARRRLGERFPWATWCLAPLGSTVFVLREIGLRAARGRQVALLEDHVRVAPGWRAALEDVLRGAAVAGGPVVWGGGSLRAFALHLVEYSALMPPLSDGACPGLLAVNAAYRRDALDEVAASWRGGFYDNEVHDALAARGHLPQAAAGAVVESRLELPFPRALRHLFEGGRRYGAYRRASGPALMRVRRVLAAPLVPLVLQARILRRVGRCRPRELGRALRAQPQVAALLLAWGGGELVGGLVGDDRAARAH